MKQGTEIVEMLFKELTREEDLEISRLDGYEEGFNSGERAGFSKGERAGAEQKLKFCHKFFHNFASSFSILSHGKPTTLS